MKLLRVVAVLHAAAVCAQPLLAGLYLNGEGSAIPIHESVGLTATALCLAQLVLTSLVTRLLWPSLLTGAVLAGEALMIHAGYGRELAVHIPLGMAVVAGSVSLAVWTVRQTAAAA
ncbi:hypothetical protein [Kribbella italica]|uniref:DoxX family protein n=1 Tax=Kribbella italica TaxID=1540520 RepID=A0A7W9J9U5_9ACTN|nr:hypothetical protein [Kribbella italica]MBB5837984.1 hypothetical protein [Kribbella italica]